MFPVSTHRQPSHYHFSYDRTLLTKALKNMSIFPFYFFVREKKMYVSILLLSLQFLNNNYLNKPGR